MAGNPDEIHLDGDGKPILAGLDVATGKAVNIRAVSIAQDANGDYYGDLYTAGGGGGLSADVFSSSTALASATAFSGVPTVSQLVAGSYASLANTGSEATFIAALLVASAFNGTLSFYGLEPDNATLQLINAHLRGASTNSNSTTINVSSATNQVWMGSAATFKTIYIVCTSFTSGSIAAQLGLTSAPYAVAIINTPSVALTTGAGVAIASPPANTNAGSDTALTLASTGKHFLIQNNSPANANIELDATATVGSTLLLPGAVWRDDISVSVIHVLTAAAQPVNAANGIIVKVWA